MTVRAGMRMRAATTGGRAFARLRPFKPCFLYIQPIYKRINHPYRIIFPYVIFYAVRQQRDLPAVLTFYIFHI